MSGGRFAVAVLAGLAPACGPAEDGGFARFRAEALPVLEARCFSETCHGVPPGAEEAGDAIDWSQLFVRTDAAGLALDADEAYTQARRRINAIERPELSTLLRKGLPLRDGGLPHWGGEVFRGPDDEAYGALLGWIASEEDGGEGRRVEDLDPLVRRFAEDVLPALATRQCMNQNCHGPTSPFTAFEPPMPLDGALVFPAAAVEKNHATARHFVHLGGPAPWSRLVRKALPLADGGIAHRGGNRLFFTGRDDPAVAQILAWADAERAAVVGEEGYGLVRGLVLVRGPLARTPPFELRVFSPGTDVWIVEQQPEHAGNPARNLTAAAHPGAAADARDPAVSHDARRIAFAMRRAADGAHNLYEIGVDGAGLRQLTFDDAPAIANRHPTYGPDGRIYFASNRAGHAADGAALPDAEIWAVDPASGALERLTFDPSPEARPAFFPTGKSYGTLGFTVLRALGGARQGVVFRMPLDHDKAHHADPELHIHHGASAPERITWGMRSLPDGRFAAVLLPADAAGDAGTLAIVERQFGPEVPEGAEDEAAVPGFRHAVARLDARAWRDPAPAPDGSLFAAVAEGGAPPRIVRFWLEEDPASGQPRVVRETRVTDLADGDALAEWEPEPIALRPPEDDPDHAPAWDPAARTGVLDYRHVETLEAIFARLEVRGPKAIRDDLRFVRLVESVAAPPGAPASLTPYGAARILGELELADGSVLAEVPANVPFRLQFLDARRLAVGAQQNRWLAVAPGERFPGGIAPEVYPTACAGCHGALDGDPAHALGPPDAITRASITRATHEERNPRRPRAPVAVGGAPIAADWASVVRPLVVRSCTGCHGAAAAGGLDLRPLHAGAFDAGYRAILAGGAVVPGHAAESALLARLEGACAGAPPLGEAERLAVARWIDVGAIYRGEP